MKSAKSFLIAGSFLTMLMPRAIGQTGPTLVGAGYAAPTLTVAPGEIVTLQVTGINTILSSPVLAQDTPLPTQLAGISVTLNQYAHGVALLQQSITIPLMSIQQTNNCSAVETTVTSDCLVTVITGQIPFEMVATVVGSPVTTLVVSENGTQSKSFSVNPNPMNIHVLTSCGTPSKAVCVTHADGTLVTAASPAVPGETVVIYAVGLGQTTPAVTTGAATPVSAPGVSAGIAIQFDFSPNAGPKFPTASVVDESVNSYATFVGLSPGQVGLYQINVTLPGTFPAVPPCSGGGIYWATASNLSIDIFTNFLSYDAAPICVQPPQ